MRRQVAESVQIFLVTIAPCWLTHLAVGAASSSRGELTWASGASTSCQAVTLRRTRYAGVRNHVRAQDRLQILLSSCHRPRID